MIEIERKFLVTSAAFKKESFRDMGIVQGFLNTHPERTVRVRMKGSIFNRKRKIQYGRNH